MRNRQPPPEDTLYRDNEIASEHVVSRIELNGSDEAQRLGRLESRLDKQERTLAMIVKEIGRVSGDIKQLSAAVKGAPPKRTSSSRSLQAVMRPMTDADMKIGGQYVFQVANPRAPYYARAMIMGVIDDPSGGKLYRFSRPDTGRSFFSRPRPANEFFEVPEGWKDPTESDDEEEDVGVRSTNRPRPR